MALALVTGGTGFCGAWIAKAQLERGVDVVALSSSVSASTRPTSLALLEIETEVDRAKVDVTDAEAVERAMGRYRPDVVFHLAARSNVRSSSSDPIQTLEVNARGTWHVLEACRDRGTPVVIASSIRALDSSAVSRSAPHGSAGSVYGASKAVAETLARSFWHDYGLPVAALRFANVFGEADTDLTRLIPSVVIAARDRRPVELRSDGSPEREMLHVEDAARAYLAVADALGDNRLGGATLNVSRNEPSSVLDLARMIVALSGSDVDVIPASGGGETAQRWQPDGSELRELTRWEPRISLEDGLRRTIAWYRNHPELRPSAPAD
jgi:CDP-glucose 4,6-dehydratase